MVDSTAEHVIGRFLDQYGKAVSDGDLAAIAACWDVPALVLGDDGVQAVGKVREIEEFFRQAAAWYHEQGLMSTASRVLQIERLGKRLFSVDVRWAVLDSAGVEQQAELSRYILLLGQEGEPRIRVALSFPPPQ